ncbi:MAG: RdgB/HAM1 family non-canonical purine NTP pyrophosphatase [Alphaproteobacteria bacterium]|nr:RdgB/HAM1 family non-canonical purine NTP pyrophosphatase [Alphaproteobacteria bacterium]
MPKPFSRLVIATHNAGKLREFAGLLGHLIPEITSAGSLGLPVPEETGTTFIENATLKARAAAEATGSLALADDSGLCIHTLNGDPGVYSADWAEPGKNFQAAIARIQKEMGDAPDRSAHFTCVLVLCWPDGRTESVEGRVEGSIAREMRGTGGHGYDPIFIPDGDTRTFAEMGETEKNRISHRGNATKLLLEKFAALL